VKDHAHGVSKTSASTLRGSRAVGAADGARIALLRQVARETCAEGAAKVRDRDAMDMGLDVFRGPAMDLGTESL